MLVNLNQVLKRAQENHYAVGHYEFLGYGVPAH